MNRISKFTLCICMTFVMSILMCSAVFAEYYEFSISADESCGVGDTVDVTIELSSDEMINDSDAFFVYDTEYFEYVESESDEHDDYAGTVRLRGDFSENSYSCTWNVTLKAISEGASEFSITDKWVQNGNSQVVSSTAESFEIEVSGEGTNTATDTGNDADLATAVSYSKEFEFNFETPGSVPSCFEETTAEICGESCRAWKLNSGMAENVDYTADLGDFYAVYGSQDSEEAAWYLYDSKEESFQRLVMLNDIEVEATAAPEKEEVKESDSSEKESPDIISDVIHIIIIVFIILVVLIVVINIIFNKIEKRERMRRKQERRRASHEELRQKREQERRISENQSSYGPSHNTRRPEDK